MANIKLREMLLCLSLRSLLPPLLWTLCWCSIFSTGLCCLLLGSPSLAGSSPHRYSITLNSSIPLDPKVQNWKCKFYFTVHTYITKWIGAFCFFAFQLHILFTSTAFFISISRHHSLFSRILFRAKNWTFQSCVKGSSHLVLVCCTSYVFNKGPRIIVFF